MLGTKVLEERQSKYNRDIKVVKTWGMGTYIQVDGLTQSGGIVESIWRQTLKRIYNLKFTINNCLILGLGGGTAAKLIRKYWPEAKITGVEIDPVMIELGTRYLALGTSKTKIVIGDARKFKLSKYDLVIVDCYLGDEYVDLLPEGFKKSKLVIFNRLFFADKKNEAIKFGKKLERIFNHVEIYYPSVNIMFICSN